MNTKHGVGIWWISGIYVIATGKLLSTILLRLLKW
jgi:hypothetical protein